MAWCPGNCFRQNSSPNACAPVYGQTVVHRVPWVKADNVVVAFYIFPLLVLPIAEIGAHTGNGKILVAAVQRGYSIVLPEHEPPVFIKGGLHGKLVMFKGEVLLGCRHTSAFLELICLNVANSVTYLSQDFKLQGSKVRNGGADFNGQGVVWCAVLVEGAGNLIEVATDFSIFGGQPANGGQQFIIDRGKR